MALHTTFHNPGKAAIQTGQLTNLGTLNINLLDDHLKQLPYAAQAVFNHIDQENDLTCLQGTRVEILEEIYKWADDQNERCIFWLSGLAGTGKSTIARTVARRLYENRTLGASFFFSRGSGDVGTTNKFVTTIALQLAATSYSLQKFIGEAVQRQRNIADQSLPDQWRHLVLDPLAKVDGDPSHSSYIIIVDALDECEGSGNIGTIIQLLAEARTLKAARLRLLITSRPGFPIQQGFRGLPTDNYRVCALHDVSPDTVNRDLYVFLKTKFKLFAKDRYLGSDWPGEAVIARLVQKANGLFIWAATACRFICEDDLLSSQRLSDILRNNSTSFGPEEELNNIYLTVLTHALSSALSAKEKSFVYGLVRLILGSVVTLFSPLPVSSLSALLHNTEESEINGVLKHLHAIIDVPTDKYHALCLHHPSFCDFLLNQERCTEQNLHVGEKQAHTILTGCCIHLMSQTLMRPGVCGRNDPGVHVTDVEKNEVEQNLPPEVQYACLYWVQHLQRSGAQIHKDDQVHVFLQKHLLFWLEALCWMERLPEGILAICSLETIALTLQGHSSAVGSIVFSPDGKLLENAVSTYEQAPPVPVGHSAIHTATPPPGHCIAPPRPPPPSGADDRGIIPLVSSCCLRSSQSRSPDPPAWLRNRRAPVGIGSLLTTIHALESLSRTLGDPPRRRGPRRMVLAGILPPAPNAVSAGPTGPTAAAGDVLPCQLPAAAAGCNPNQS
ncbi:hypothetical protein CNMCM6805_003133 [Aspergillus fumigatiaffinis]|uniref:NACHT domain-containing protein n=1 Tax=Aspergillus fumigatiaffinis TaxID=340414 RepID=A0A8H4GS04_9EURO|nr:hypothetical protein CNMCM6805_003133 [Aspergillus fumigatiaffinis]